MSKATTIDQQATALATKHYLKQGYFGGKTVRGRVKHFDFSAAKKHYIDKLKDEQTN